MVATIILGGIVFGLAVLGLSLGVIFNKKTPLKGHCHTPVDGSMGCGSCGDRDDTCNPEPPRKPINPADYPIEATSAKVDLRR